MFFLFLIFLKTNSIYVCTSDMPSHSMSLQNQWIVILLSRMEAYLRPILSCQSFQRETAKGACIQETTENEDGCKGLRWGQGMRTSQSS